MARPKPLLLTILDGWGYSPVFEGNAIVAALKPNYDQLLRELQAAQRPVLVIGVSSHDEGNAALLNAGAAAICMGEAVLRPRRCSVRTVSIVCSVNE